MSMSETDLHPPSPPPALFLHIPKTAGTTAIEYLAGFYGNQQTLSHADYMNYRSEEVASVRLITGHFGYDYAKGFMPERFCFTFLREPIDRILSFYDFCLGQNPDEYDLYRLVQTNSLDRLLEMALEDRNNYSHLWNNQVWMLAHGWGGKLCYDDFSDEELLHLAKGHLAEFSAVGFMESFDEDFAGILGRLELPVPDHLPRVNASRHRTSRKELPARTRYLLGCLTELDQVFYQHAWSRRNTP